MSLQKIGKEVINTQAFLAGYLGDDSPQDISHRQLDAFESGLPWKLMLAFPGVDETTRRLLDAAQEEYVRSVYVWRDDLTNLEFEKRHIKDLEQAIASGDTNLFGNNWHIMLSVILNPSHAYRGAMNFCLRVFFAYAESLDDCLDLPVTFQKIIDCVQKNSQLIEKIREAIDLWRTQQNGSGLNACLLEVYLLVRKELNFSTTIFSG